MRFARPDSREEKPSPDRPDLAATFEHYGIPVSGRTSQMVRCPVHGDRSPSCSVNVEKQLFNCHSCDAGGTAWDLIMKMEGLDFDGARTFAATLGLPIGDAGGGDEELPGSGYGSRRKVPARKGDRPRGGAYKPSWRRS